MGKTTKISRRSMITVGAGVAASVVTAGVLGNQAQITPPNPEGPFYPMRPQVDKDTDLTLIQGNTERAQGQMIRVTGKVLDENGQPVEGALVDIWQANGHGRYHHEDDTASTHSIPISRAGAWSRQMLKATTRSPPSNRAPIWRRKVGQNHHIFTTRFLVVDTVKSPHKCIFRKKV